MTDDKLREEIDRLHARIDAWKTVFTVLVTVIGNIEPEATDDIMRGLSSFEGRLRMVNERDAVLRELRAVREIVAAVERPEGSEEDE